MLKKVGFILLIVLILIQFFRPVKNINTKPDGIENDISKKILVPDSIVSILKTSCYDCHSNNSHYPWYAAVQPVTWWLQDHINEGKEEINFNEFASYSLRRQYKKLEEIIKQLKEDEMPLSSYTLIHRDAILSDGQKKAVIAWASAWKDTMQLKYPADSLKRK